MRFTPFHRLGLAAAAFSATLALGATSGVSTSSFLVTQRATVDADPTAAYNAITQVSKWWNPAHTWSGEAGNLSIEPRAGGCFCERWGTNSVEHARVIGAQPGKLLRLQGALGPLQEMGATGVMSFAVASDAGKTAITLTYRVRATADAALDKVAPAVDKVLGEQLQRLVSFMSGGGVPSAANNAFAASLTDKFFDSNGVRIRYVESGAGDPIILVHGYANRVEDQWIDTGVMPALARQFRVIAFDARGHGKSGKPHDPKQYGPEMGLDVIRLMDHLGIQRAHIAGYSMGAHIAAQLATTHPQRFTTMTLGGAAGRFHWTAEDDKRAEDEAAKMEDSRLAGQDPKALAAVRRSSRDQAVTQEQLAAVAITTLGIVGTNDPNMGDFVRLKAVMPRMWRMTAIPGATHANAPSRPEFLVAMQYFLNYHTTSAVK